MISKKYSSKPFSLTPAIRKAGFDQAELVLHGVDHSGPSYQGRIFFNNSAASEKTPKSLEAGYAGAFNIFGHGRCWGDKGHCCVPTQRPFDNRSPHPLTPREVVVDVTEALRKAAVEGGKLSVTVVPVVRAAAERRDARDCFHFHKMALRIRSSHGLLHDPRISQAAEAVRVPIPKGITSAKEKPIS